MSFSEVDEEKFIECVAKHPIIYDASHADYRNLLAKENIWKTIAQELSKTSEDCKKKWRSIRDGYQRFKKKRKLGTGSAAPKNSKGKRHQLLSFLEDVPQHRSGGSNISPPQFPVPSQQDIIETEETADNGGEDGEAMSELSELQDKNNEEENISEQRPKVKRIKRGNNDDRLLKLLKDRDDKRQHLLRTIYKKKDDDVELFCFHIGEVLRSLPPVYKAEAKKQIGVLILDYEIKAAKMQGNTEPRDINTSSTPQYHSYDFVTPYTSQSSESTYDEDYLNLP